MACGRNREGQCDLPALVEGLTYTQVAAGGGHTVLLRSDGSAVACGCNHSGECDLPALVEGLTYVAQLPPLLLQASFDGASVLLWTLGGEERHRLGAAPGALLADVRALLAADCRAGRLGPGVARVDALLPGGRLLSAAPAGETVAAAFGLVPRG